MDIVKFIMKVKNDLPLFIMGHSLGGGLSLIIANNNIECEFSGVILCAPFVQFSEKLVNFP